MEVHARVGREKHQGGYGVSDFIESQLQRALTRWRKRMKVKLFEKKHRGASWANDTPNSLARRVYQELAELEFAINSKQPVVEVEREAADVANMAMMVADAYAKRAKRIKAAASP